MKLTAEILRTQWRELSKNSLPLRDAASLTTQLSTPVVTADLIVLEYKTMPGNKPNTYGNYVAMWQNNATIPWNDDHPLDVQNISTDTTDGDENFTNLDVTKLSYIIGYAVGPTLGGGASGQKHGNICATAYVPASGSPQQATIFTPSVQITFAGANSIAVRYNLPTGLTPRSNGAWIGLWRSAQVPYNQTPLAANNIQLDVESGTAFINDLSIGRGETYVVGLFMSGWGAGSKPNNQKTLACSVNFTS